MFDGTGTREDPQRRGRFDARGYVKIDEPVRQTHFHPTRQIQDSAGRHTQRTALDQGEEHGAVNGQRLTGLQRVADVSCPMPPKPASYVDATVVQARDGPDDG